jgi:polyisoprenoid-binding protein YceI
MLKKFFIVSSFLLAPITASAAGMTAVSEMPSGVYTLDKTHASVTWKVSHLGLSNYTARFTSIDAELNFDTKDPTKSTLTASVDPASVRTDYPNAAEKDFDAKLAKGKEWFNAGEFPKISFVSKKITMTGKNTGDVTGDLTLLGITKPVTLNVTFNGAYLKKPFVEAPGIGFSATATLKRSDWGFKTYVPMIGDDVTLLIETEFHQLPVEKK